MVRGLIAMTVKKYVILSASEISHRTTDKAIIQSYRL